MSEQKYPVGMQSFAEIRQQGFVYVDKSQYIQPMLDRGKYFFLSRPRRFGKSLFLSMLKSYYCGERELFEGLAAYNNDYDWEPSPVFHFDFTGQNYTEPDSLYLSMKDFFLEYEGKYGYTYVGNDPGERFRLLIRKAYETTGKQVVILIDEYDKPLLDTVDNPELQNKYRNILRGLYGNLKRMDSYIRFALLTGVSRFGKLSIFSDLNNLNDISMEQEFCGICGITSEELHEYFEPGIAEFSKKWEQSEQETYHLLKENYDGYHFTKECRPDVYNPFSLLKALQAKSIDFYWFATGTPTFLVALIRNRRIKLQTLDEFKEPIDNVTSISFDLKSTLAPVLYQTGYLTIKAYNQKTHMLTLGFPNTEVRRGFLLQLLNVYTNEKTTRSWTDIVEFYDDVESGHAEDFMVRLQSMFADFNSDGFNHVELEQHYQDVCYLVFRLLGCLTKVEYKTSAGRIDMVVEMPDYIYVFEFKRNGTPEDALKQIDRNNYLLPYRADGRRLIKIGANFSDKLKGLESWIITE
ncbi:MAG: ATP-binding protein [Muribaculum sp.]|nr:ATP-binding protein [Muribaculum sp.]